ncbi:hypothetical protein BDQ12DRAFT_47880 [Crucibulum laeve]|uniref:Uncharacterized protein n=1 Tax=Crucibulum laeve TaxID=68775 RepID=A0A5C3ML81_9AGAR|nr:hypothetical protein BDQ12DRAFT_47880 [Crucibulum laeve]
MKVTSFILLTIIRVSSFPYAKKKNSPPITLNPLTVTLYLYCLNPLLFARLPPSHPLFFVPSKVFFTPSASGNSQIRG